MTDYQIQTPMRQRRKRTKKKPFGWGLVLILVGIGIVVGWNDFGKGDTEHPTVLKKNASPTVSTLPKRSRSNSEVQFSFVGDVIFAGRVKSRMENDGYAYPYQFVESLLRADVTVANMETPVTTKGNAQTKEYTYQSTPQALPAFRQAGFDVVTLANNHVLDYGVDGLVDTMKQLNINGIKYVGAGMNETEAFRPVILKRNGIKIAFLGFSRVVPNVSWKALNPSSAYPHGLPGIANAYEVTKTIDAVRSAKQLADIVVILPHWGIERETVPSSFQVDLAHQWIDAGADLIVGSHPHVLQAIENYKGKWIAYSMGNFIFTTNPNSVETWNSAVLRSTCSSSGTCNIQLVPVHNEGLLPKPMNAQQAETLWRKLERISPGIKFDAQGHAQGD